MDENEYFVTHSAGHIPCDSISRELPNGSFEEISYQEVVDKLNENKWLKQQLNMKLYSRRQLEAFHYRVFDLIDKKIKEYEELDHQANCGDVICVKYTLQIQVLKELKDELKE